jgi:hypothetical protein
MRLIALGVALILAGCPGVSEARQRPPASTPSSTAPDTGAAGGAASGTQSQPQSSTQQSSQENTGAQPDKKTPADKAGEKSDAPSLQLPVSVNRIRQALAQPAEPLRGLKGLDETPTFRVEVRERMKIEELLQSLNFKSGPPVPGGLYGYEQQRQLFPSVDNPLVQPYAAFNQGELLTILVENLVGRYLAGRAMSAISAADRARAEAAAREEVSHAIAEYCAAQPNHGAGIQLCIPSPER